MYSGFTYIKKGILDVLFPHVCVLCGLRLSTKEQFVCTECIKMRFEAANPEMKAVSSNTLLPEGIVLQQALWKFDKGGYLQDLLHQLKYGRLTGVGEDLGIELAYSLQINPFFVYDENMALLPVPLHPKKMRIRGYNQAFFIAKGISEVTGIPILENKAVLRVKNTKTQTGFSLEKRRENIGGAFSVNLPDKLFNKTIIIVDDVFTTGATVFELAGELQKHGVQKIMIATIAQA